MKRLAGIVALVWMSVAQSQSPTQPSAPAAPDPADVATATTYVKEAWNDFTHCRRPSACNGYFESFGVAISFGDGRITPFAHLQRLNATTRDCIKLARTYLDEGDRGLAVQWAMASRVENARVRDWMGSHPDAVVEALRHCCGS